MGHLYACMTLCLLALSHLACSSPLPQEDIPSTSQPSTNITSSLPFPNITNTTIDEDRWLMHYTPKGVTFNPGLEQHHLFKALASAFEHALFISQDRLTKITWTAPNTHGIEVAFTMTEPGATSLDRTSLGAALGSMCECIFSSQRMQGGEGVLVRSYMGVGVEVGRVYLKTKTPWQVGEIGMANNMTITTLKRSEEEETQDTIVEHIDKNLKTDLKQGKELGNIPLPERDVFQSLFKAMFETFGFEAQLQFVSFVENKCMTWIAPAGKQINILSRDVMEALVDLVNWECSTPAGDLPRAAVIDISIKRTLVATGYMKSIWHPPEVAGVSVS